MGGYFKGAMPMFNNEVIRGIKYYFSIKCIYRNKTNKGY